MNRYLDSSTPSDPENVSYELKKQNKTISYILSLITTHQQTKIMETVRKVPLTLLFYLNRASDLRGYLSYNDSWLQL